MSAPGFDPGVGYGGAPIKTPEQIQFEEENIGFDEAVADWAPPPAPPPPTIDPGFAPPAQQVFDVGYEAEPPPPAPPPGVGFFEETPEDVGQPWSPEVTYTDNSAFFETAPEAPAMPPELEANLGHNFFENTDQQVGWWQSEVEKAIMAGDQARLEQLLEEGDTFQQWSEAWNEYVGSEDYQRYADEVERYNDFWSPLTQNEGQFRLEPLATPGVSYQTTGTDLFRGDEVPVYEQILRRDIQANREELQARRDAKLRDWAVTQSQDYQTMLEVWNDYNTTALVRGPRPDLFEFAALSPQEQYQVVAGYFRDNLPHDIFERARFTVENGALYIQSVLGAREANLRQLQLMPTDRTGLDQREISYQLGLIAHQFEPMPEEHSALGNFVKGSFEAGVGMVGLSDNKTVTKLADHLSNWGVSAADWTSMQVASAAGQVQGLLEQPVPDLRRVMEGDFDLSTQHDRLGRPYRDTTVGQGLFTLGMSGNPYWRSLINFRTNSRSDRNLPRVGQAIGGVWEHDWNPLKYLWYGYDETVKYLGRESYILYNTLPSLAHGASAFTLQPLIVPEALLKMLGGELPDAFSPSYHINEAADTGNLTRTLTLGLYWEGYGWVESPEALYDPFSSNRRNAIRGDLLKEYDQSPWTQAFFETVADPTNYVGAVITKPLRLAARGQLVGNLSKGLLVRHPNARRAFQNYVAKNPSLYDMYRLQVHADEFFLTRFGQEGETLDELIARQVTPENLNNPLVRREFEESALAMYLQLRALPSDAAPDRIRSIVGAETSLLSNRLDALAQAAGPRGQRLLATPPIGDTPISQEERFGNFVERLTNEFMTLSNYRLGEEGWQRQVRTITSQSRQALAVDATRTAEQVAESEVHARVIVTDVWDDEQLKLAIAKKGIAEKLADAPVQGPEPFTGPLPDALRPAASPEAVVADAISAPAGQSSYAPALDVVPGEVRQARVTNPDVTRASASPDPVETDVAEILSEVNRRTINRDVKHGWANHWLDEQSYQAFQSELSLTADQIMRAPQSWPNVERGTNAQGKFLTTRMEAGAPVSFYQLEELERLSLGTGRDYMKDLLRLNNEGLFDYAHVNALIQRSLNEQPASPKLLKLAMDLQREGKLEPELDIWQLSQRQLQDRISQTIGKHREVALPDPYVPVETWGLIDELSGHPMGFAQHPYKHAFMNEAIDDIAVVLGFEERLYENVRFMRHYLGFSGATPPATVAGPIDLFSLQRALKDDLYLRKHPVAGPLIEDLLKDGQGPNGELRHHSLWILEHLTSADFLSSLDERALARLRLNIMRTFYSRGPDVEDELRLGHELVAPAVDRLLNHAGEVGAETAQVASEGRQAAHAAELEAKLDEAAREVADLEEGIELVRGVIPWGQEARTAFLDAARSAERWTQSEIRRWAKDYYGLTDEQAMTLARNIATGIRNYNRRHGLRSFKAGVLDLAQRDARARQAVERMLEARADLERFESEVALHDPAQGRGLKIRTPASKAEHIVLVARNELAEALSGKTAFPDIPTRVANLTPEARAGLGARLEGQEGPLAEEIRTQIRIADAADPGGLTIRTTSDAPTIKEARQKIADTAAASAGAYVQEQATKPAAMARIEDTPPVARPRKPTGRRKYAPFVPTAYGAEQRIYQLPFAVRDLAEEVAPRLLAPNGTPYDAESFYKAWYGFFDGLLSIESGDTVWDAQLLRTTTPEPSESLVVQARKSQAIHDEAIRRTIKVAPKVEARPREDLLNIEPGLPKLRQFPIPGGELPLTLVHSDYIERYFGEGAVEKLIEAKLLTRKNLRELREISPSARTFLYGKKANYVAVTKAGDMLRRYFTARLDRDIPLLELGDMYEQWVSDFKVFITDWIDADRGQASDGLPTLIHDLAGAFGDVFRGPTNAEYVEGQNPWPAIEAVARELWHESQMVGFNAELKAFMIDREFRDPRGHVTPGGQGGPNPVGLFNDAVSRLEGRGFKMRGHAEIVEWLNDPRFDPASLHAARQTPGSVDPALEIASSTNKQLLRRSPGFESQATVNRIMRRDLPDQGEWVPGADRLEELWLHHGRPDADELARRVELFKEAVKLDPETDLPYPPEFVRWVLELGDMSAMAKRIEWHNSFYSARQGVVEDSPLDMGSSYDEIVEDPFGTGELRISGGESGKTFMGLAVGPGANPQSTSYVPMFMRRSYYDDKGRLLYEEMAPNQPERWLGEDMRGSSSKVFGPPEGYQTVRSYVPDDEIQELAAAGRVRHEDQMVRIAPPHRTLDPEGYDAFMLKYRGFVPRATGNRAKLLDADPTYNTPIAAVFDAIVEGMQGTGVEPELFSRGGEFDAIKMIHEGNIADDFDPQARRRVPGRTKLKLLERKGYAREVSPGMFELSDNAIDIIISRMLGQAMLKDLTPLQREQSIRHHILTRTGEFLDALPEDMIEARDRLTLRILGKDVATVPENFRAAVDRLVEAYLEAFHSPPGAVSDGFRAFWKVSDAVAGALEDTRPVLFARRKLFFPPRQLPTTIAPHQHAWRKVLFDPQVRKRWEDALDAHYIEQQKDIQIMAEKWGIDGRNHTLMAQAQRVGDVLAGDLGLWADELAASQGTNRKGQPIYEHHDFYDDVHRVLKVLAGAEGDPNKAYVKLADGRVINPLLDRWEFYNSTKYGQMILKAYKAHGRALSKRWQQIKPHTSVTDFLAEPIFDEVHPSYKLPSLGKQQVRRLRDLLPTPESITLPGGAIQEHMFTVESLKRYHTFFSDKGNYFGISDAELDANGGFLRQKLDDWRLAHREQWHGLTGKQGAKHRVFYPPRKGAAPEWHATPVETLDHIFFPKERTEPVDILGLTEGLQREVVSLEGARLGYDPFKTGGVRDMNMRLMHGIKKQLTPLWMSGVPRYHVNNFMGNVMAALLLALRGDNHFGLLPRNGKVLRAVERSGSGIAPDPYIEGGMTLTREHMAGASELGKTGEIELPFLARGKYNPLRKGMDLADGMERYFKRHVWSNEFAGSYADEWSTRLELLWSDPSRELPLALRKELSQALGIDEVQVILNHHEIKGHTKTRILEAQRTAIAIARDSAYRVTASGLRDYRMRNKVDSVLDHFFPVHYWTTHNYLFVGDTLLHRPQITFGAARIYNAWAQGWEDESPSKRNKLRLFTVPNGVPFIGGEEIWLRPQQITNPAFYAMPQALSETRKAWNRYEDMGFWDRFYLTSKDGIRNLWDALGYRFGPQYELGIHGLARGDERWGLTAGTDSEMGELLGTDVSVMRAGMQMLKEGAGTEDYFRPTALPLGDWPELAKGLPVVGDEWAEVIDWITQKVFGTEMSRGELLAISQQLYGYYQEGEYGTAGSDEALLAYFAELEQLAGGDLSSTRIKRARREVDQRASVHGLASVFGMPFSFYAGATEQAFEDTLTFQSIADSSDLLVLTKGARNPEHPMYERWLALNEEIFQAQQQRDQELEAGKDWIAVDERYNATVSKIWGKAHDLRLPIANRRGAGAEWDWMREHAPALYGYWAMDWGQERLHEARDKIVVNATVGAWRTSRRHDGQDRREANSRFQPVFDRLSALDTEFEQTMATTDNQFLKEQFEEQYRIDKAALWLELEKLGYTPTGTGQLPQHGDSYYLWRYGPTTRSAPVVTPSGVLEVGKVADPFNKSPEFLSWLASEDALGQVDRAERQAAQREHLLRSVIDMADLNLYDEDGYVVEDYQLNGDPSKVDWAKYEAQIRKEAKHAPEYFDRLVRLYQSDANDLELTGVVGYLVDPGGTLQPSEFIAYAKRVMPETSQFFEEMNEARQIYFQLAPDESAEYNGEVYTKDELGRQLVRDFGPEVLRRRDRAPEDYERLMISQDTEGNLIAESTIAASDNPDEVYRIEEGRYAVRNYYYNEMTPGEQKKLRDEFGYAVEEAQGTNEDGTTYTYERFNPELLEPNDVFEIRYRHGIRLPASGNPRDPLSSTTRGAEPSAKVEHMLLSDQAKAAKKAVDEQVYYSEDDKQKIEQWERFTSRYPDLETKAGEDKEALDLSWNQLAKYYVEQGLYDLAQYVEGRNDLADELGIYAIFGKRDEFLRNDPQGQLVAADMGPVHEGYVPDEPREQKNPELSSLEDFYWSMDMLYGDDRGRWDQFQGFLANHRRDIMVAEHHRHLNPDMSWAETAAYLERIGEHDAAQTVKQRNELFEQLGISELYDQRASWLLTSEDGARLRALDPKYDEYLPDPDFGGRSYGQRSSRNWGGGSGRSYSSGYAQRSSSRPGGYRSASSYPSSPGERAESQRVIAGLRGLDPLLLDDASPDVGVRREYAGAASVVLGRLLALFALLPRDQAQVLTGNLWAGVQVQLPANPTLDDWERFMRWLSLDPDQIRAAMEALLGSEGSVSVPIEAAAGAPPPPPLPLSPAMPAPIGYGGGPGATGPVSTGPGDMGFTEFGPGEGPAMPGLTPPAGPAGIGYGPY